MREWVAYILDNTGKRLSRFVTFAKDREGAMSTAYARASEYPNVGDVFVHAL